MAVIFKRFFLITRHTKQKFNFYYLRQTKNYELMFATKRKEHLKLKKDFFEWPFVEL